MVVHNTSLSSSVPLRVGCDRWLICIWNHHWADPNLIGRNLTNCPEVEQPPIANNHESKPLPEKSELQTELQVMKTKNFIITIPPLLSFYRTPDASKNPCQIIHVISDIHRRTVSFLGPPRANLLHEQSYSASHWLGFCWVLGICFSGKSILNTTSVTKSSVNLNPYLHQPTMNLFLFVCCIVFVAELGIGGNKVFWKSTDFWCLRNPGWESLVTHEKMVQRRRGWPLKTLPKPLLEIVILDHPTEFIHPSPSPQSTMKKLLKVYGSTAVHVQYLQAKEAALR